MTHSHQKPTVFTDEEKRAFRADIDAMRRPGAHEPGRWSVSPLNRDPAVVGAMRRRSPCGTSP